MWEFIKNNLLFLDQNTWTSRLMFVLFLVSLVYLLIDRSKSTRRVFWYSIILLSVVIYNPYFWFGLVRKVFSADDDVRLRLFWLLPAYLIIAYFLMRLVFLGKKWYLCAGIAVLCILVIRKAGVPFHPEVLVEKENKYKISEEAKQSADLILQDMKESPEGLPDRPAALELCTTDIWDDVSPANWYHYGIRQYTSDFSIDPIMVLPEEGEAFSVDDYEGGPCQYLVCERVDDFLQEAERAGYRKIGETENHVLFRLAA